MASLITNRLFNCTSPRLFTPVTRHLLCNKQLQKNLAERVTQSYSNVLSEQQAFEKWDRRIENVMTWTGITGALGALRGAVLGTLPIWGPITIARAMVQQDKPK